MVLFRDLSRHFKEASNSKIFWNVFFLILSYSLPYYLGGIKPMIYTQVVIAILSFVLVAISDGEVDEIWRDILALWFTLGTLVVLFCVLLYYTILNPTWKIIKGFNKWIDSIEFKYNANKD